MNGSKLPALPPLKLAKIEKRRKKKRVLTEEEIQEKLERAEERRKVGFRNSWIVCELFIVLTMFILRT
jgi:integrase